jgi:hypothetical protein
MTTRPDEYAPVTQYKFDKFEGDRRRYYLASGYFSKMPTDYMVKLEGSNRWHRVYTMCYSNSGTNYVIFRGEKLLVYWQDLLPSS